MLLYAILVVYTRTSVADLNTRVAEVRRYEASYISMPQGGAFAALRTPGNPSQCPPWRFPGL
eukprot:5426169-Prymnesium_polylepis.1